MDSINPTTEQKIKSYPEMSAQEVRRILKSAETAFKKWRLTSFAERSTKLKKVAELLEQNKSSLARLMAEEMGKPLIQGVGEIEKCAGGSIYYAEEGASQLAPELIKTDASKSYITYEPLGTLLAIMPWNFPFWQVIRCAAPNVMAGNAVILKHASNVTGCALAIEDIFLKAGFPEGLFKSLVIETKDVARVIRSPLIHAVTLTGSTRAGRDVASRSGKVLKKTVLELGGSDAYVILEDADLELTAVACAASRMINGGQSCIAAKRFIVVESVRKEFERLFVQRMEMEKMGDPTDPGTTLGPLARMDLREGVHDQVQRSIAKGARLLTGGKKPAAKGAFYPATVLTDVGKGMPAYEEEIFGPVAALIPVKNEKQAIKIANDSVFGLGAAVFTQDLAKGERIASKELEAGSCFVNAFVRSDYRLPFGGIKESGYGRELSYYGLKEFTNVKTVFIR